MPNCVAPPAIKSAWVGLPSWIVLTRAAFVVVGLGTRHTLASYLSKHTVPATTASPGHVFTGVLGKSASTGLATPISSAVPRAIIFLFMLVLPSSVRMTPSGARFTLRTRKLLDVMPRVADEDVAIGVHRHANRGVELPIL